MGNCMGVKQQGGKQSNSEGRFVAMENKNVYTNKKDVVTTHKDFVVEYEDMKIFRNKYELNKTVIGKGAFGQVQKATLKTNGEQRAVKIIDKLQLDPEERVRMKYEIDILKNLNHPNIVRLYEVYENKSNIFLVTELCDGRELFDEISSRQKFAEEEAAHVIKQIMQAIAYCHGKNIAHRDLKPENILIDIKQKGAIKVIDFGTSHHYGKEQVNMHQMYGTPYYIAPEVLSGNYTEKCDMWSIGVMLYIMLCGSPPFNGSDDQIIANVKRGNWEFRGHNWADISPEAKDLVSKLMTKNVNERLTAVGALAHPWIHSQVKMKYNAKVAVKAFNNLASFNVRRIMLHLLSLGYFNQAYVL